MIPLLPLLGSLLTVGGLGLDWYLAKDMDDSVSQMQALIDSIEIGASFEDMISQCWLVFLGGFFLIWLAACIAFPKKNKRRSLI